MEFLVTLIIGAAIGFGSQYLIGKETNAVFINVLVGIVGSILGMATYYLFSFNNLASPSLLNVPALLCAAIGAMVCVLAFGGLHLALNHPEEKEPKPPETGEKQKLTQPK